MSPAPLLLAAALAGAAASGDDFALRDGDTVVFLGDSITAEGTYGRIVEAYTLLRFPDRRVRFVNAGWGGDTAAGGLARLDRDVFPHAPTVLIVAYGINDIGWGTRADDEHRRLYLDAVRGMVERCQERNVRLYLCSAAITAEDPDRAEAGFLRKMCEEGMAIAREREEHAIDVQRAMWGIQRAVLAANKSAREEKDRVTLHAADGIHLNELGQLAMAFAILKGLDAPADVSAATIDAGQPEVVEAAGCAITNLAGDTGRLAFDREDEGLPLNLGLFGALNHRFVPIPDQLNRYMLAVRGLPPGRYAITADGRGLGSFDAARLAEGVNLASATADGWEPGGPWEAQAWGLMQLTRARGEVATALRHTRHHLPAHPGEAELRERTAEADRSLVTLQHAMVRPRPFRFVIRPEPAADPGAR